MIDLYGLIANVLIATFGILAIILLMYRGNQTPKQKSTSWTDEWPTEPGFYWFYGWLWSRHSRSMEPRLDCVEVRKTGTLCVYIVKGGFMYKSEGHTGKWHPAHIPETPEL